MKETRFVWFGFLGFVCSCRQLAIFRHPPMHADHSAVFTCVSDAAATCLECLLSSISSYATEVEAHHALSELAGVLVDPEKRDQLARVMAGYPSFFGRWLRALIGTSLVYRSQAHSLHCTLG